MIVPYERALPVLAACAFAAVAAPLTLLGRLVVRGCSRIFRGRPRRPTAPHPDVDRLRMLAARELELAALEVELAHHQQLAACFRGDADAVLAARRRAVQGTKTVLAMAERAGFALSDEDRAEMEASIR